MRSVNVCCLQIQACQGPSQVFRMRRETPAIGPVLMPACVIDSPAMTVEKELSTQKNIWISKMC